MNEVKELSQSGENSHQNQWLAQISLYIDKRLDASATDKLEKHLAECAECRRELASLRQTVQVLQSLPQLKTPRSFTLTPAQARTLRPRPFYYVAQVAAAVAAIFLAASLILDLSGAFTPQAAPSSQAAAVTPTAELPLIGTRAPGTPCPDTGLACAQSGLGGEVVTPAAATPAPPVAPANLAASSESFQSIRLVELGLMLVVVVMAAFAFALRPRAPTRLKR